MWLTRFRHFRTSDTEFLSQKYLTLLRLRYGLSPDAVSNVPLLQLWPELGGVTDLAKIPDEVAASADTSPPQLLNHDWNLLLGHLMEEVDPALARKAAVFIGEVPDSGFNALTTGWGRRHLVLVQRGLELFLYRVAFIIVGSMRWRFAGPNESQVVIEPEIDMAAAAAEVQANLSLLGLGGHRMPITLSSPVTQRIAPFLAYAMQQFVIAHELGHIAQAGWRWTPPPTAREQSMLVRARQLAVSNWREEAVCDMFAADLCVKLVPRGAARFQLPETLARRLFVEAPHIVFVVMEALERDAAARGQRHSSHPPATERSRILIEHQQDYGLSAQETDLVAERCIHVATLAGL